jgi:anti-sigma regulatory factor (Ser/Thr protein kinase)
MRVERRFPCAPESVAAARLFVATTLADASRVEVVEPARLVVSELATNAIRHAGTDFGVEVDVGPVVRVAVSDQQPGELPPVTTLEPTSSSGRGLGIVAALADRWGVESLAAGKRVWWEVEF